MDWQRVVAGALVAGCSAWAVWMFLPAGPRAWLRARLGLKAPAPASGGACGGCGGCASPAPPAGTPQVVKVVRRPPA